MRAAEYFVNYVFAELTVTLATILHELKLIHTELGEKQCKIQNDHSFRKISRPGTRSQISKIQHSCKLLKLKSSFEKFNKCHGLINGQHHPTHKKETFSTQSNTAEVHALPLSINTVVDLTPKFLTNKQQNSVTTGNESN